MTMFKIFFAGCFTCLGIFLFVTAPPALPDGKAEDAGCRHPVDALFDGVNAINEAARGIYTKRIVGGGMAAGLKFGEDWREPGMEKGPLPALFLRETAAALEAMPPPLGLYLGSDAPINKSNLFAEAQRRVFETVKATREPVFSQASVAGQVAMYPDFAGVAPCVSCHNEHADSPKTDWKLNDVMGATTWTYPDETLGADAYLDAISAMFRAVEMTYETYLAKASLFEAPVPIGAGWPDTGARNLPTVEVYLEAVRIAAAPGLQAAVMRGRHRPAGAGRSATLAVSASDKPAEVPCGY